MTREDAIHYFESDQWRSMSDYELVKFQLEEERLCVPFATFHAAVSRVLGRPVFTHEFANPEAMRREFAAIPTP